MLTVRVYLLLHGDAIDAHIQVMEAVGMKKAGPQLGRLTNALLAWQLGRPDATADEARAWLAQQPQDS